jgi:hypothetical protein
MVILVHQVIPQILLEEVQEMVELVVTVEIILVVVGKMVLLLLDTELLNLCTMSTTQQVVAHG